MMDGLVVLALPSESRTFIHYRKAFSSRDYSFFSLSVSRPRPVSSKDVRLGDESSDLWLPNRSRGSPLRNHIVQRNTSRRPELRCSQFNIIKDELDEDVKDDPLKAARRRKQ